MELACGLSDYEDTQHFDCATWLHKARHKAERTVDLEVKKTANVIVGAFRVGNFLSMHFRDLLSAAQANESQRRLWRAYKDSRRGSL